ncbi:Transformation/transcription domain-associated protein, partial [Orchesella cincta]
GYISLFSGGGGDVQRFADKAHHLCVQEWKGLSKFVGGGQVRVLQGVQQVVELREAACLHQSLLANRFGEVERVVKAWYKRLPTISDDLSHWFDILCWRALNYQHIENQSSQELTAEGGDSADRKLFGVHASVQQAICQFGKVARKHGHAEVALEALEKVYELPKVPVNDCFQKLKQQFKCYFQKGRFQDAMEIMEESNLEYFGKETISEYLALKGQLLVKMGEDEEANKAFSASCHLVPENLGKNWALWGEYLEICFISQGKPELGISAITAFLRACQSFAKNEGKARKYIAKVVWLLGSYADENGTDSVLEWCEQIPSIQWLIWIPQLLTMLVEKDGKVVSNILNPLFLKPCISLCDALLDTQGGADGEIEQGICRAIGTSSGAAQQIPTIKATPSMWRCSKVMQAQRMNHPVLLSVLEGIAEELVFVSAALFLSRDLAGRTTEAVEDCVGELLPDCF